MQLTWFEQGLEQGRREGRDEGQRMLATAMLERRFGSLSAEIRQRIEQWPETRLVELVEQAFQVASPDELRLDKSDVGRN